MKNKCKICKGEGWVCEEHPEIKWGEGDGCCGAAGMPCRCNRKPLGEEVKTSSSVAQTDKFDYNAVR